MLQPIEALRNSGLLRLNEEHRQDEETFVVIGAPRSGTSMVAGALHHLGIFMGNKLTPVFEDVTLSEAVERGNSSRIDEIVRERNREHAVWGWKRPAAIDHIKLVESRLRNPCFLIVFRDIFAIANRNRISMKQDVVVNMNVSLKYYTKIVKFIGETSTPCLLISYEKAMDDKVVFASELADWVRVDRDRVSEAVKFIRPDPDDYLLTSRITKARGVLDVVARDRIGGWAILPRANSPARVAVMVNREEVAVVEANRHRRDLVDRGVHPTGDCGFLVTLGPERLLQPGDEVRARVVGDVVDLNRSPRVFGAPAA